VLNLAENCCHTMHNMCPLRGAKIRDSLAWARYLDEALQEFVPHSDAVIMQHQWPVWGAERMVELVAGQRDMYRYLHDQTLRLMSHGLTAPEIANELMMPNKLSRQWFARGYYGAVAHNVQAIYTNYLGPYDGNPAHLNELPPQEAGRKYVEYMGGADKVLERARADFGAGNFRWVVEALNHLVFADPSNRTARELAADAHEQLGYQSESATWRNSYLFAARELRSTGRSSAPRGVSINADIVAILPLGSFLEYLAIRLNGGKAQDLAAKFDWRLVGGAGVDSQRITLSNGALNHLPGSHGDAADAVIETTREQLGKVSAGRSALLAALDSNELQIKGDAALFRRFVEVLDEFDPMFNIVEP
jgi:alkyl sulfatase BDS1-like metallo-beta-lactamase superfamily hydrolase